MPTLRDIKKRIRAVINTKQITKAMEMVAAARLRKAQQTVEQARPYSEKMRLILEQISAAATTLDHPFFEQREVKSKIYVVFTSDRGLCGSYNTNVLRAVIRRLNEERNLETQLVLVGKKGDDVLRRRAFPVARVYRDLQGRLNLDIVRDLTNYLIEKFVSREVDQVH